MSILRYKSTVVARILCRDHCTSNLKDYRIRIWRYSPDSTGKTVAFHIEEVNANTVVYYFTYNGEDAYRYHVFEVDNSTSDKTQQQIKFDIYMIKQDLLKALILKDITSISTITAGFLDILEVEIDRRIGLIEIGRAHV